MTVERGGGAGVGRTLAWAAIPVALALFVQRQVLSLFFWSDDWLHLYQIATSSFAEFATTTHGGHLYWARNSIWYGLHQLVGLNAGVLFAGVLALHAVNVALLFALVRRISGSLPGAALVATLWGVMPAALGSLGWFSAFGHVLIATCVLWILLDAARLKERAGRVSAPTLVRWVLLLVVAATSYGVGLAVLIAMPVALYVLLDRSPNRPVAVGVLAALAVALSAYYTTLPPSTGTKLSPTWPAHSAEQFERFATTTFDLSHSGAGYLLLGPLGSRAEPGMGKEAQVEVSRVLFVVLVLVGLTVAVRGGPERRRWLLAGLVLGVACYAMIVLGRGFLLARMERANLLLTPRYHYAAPLALAVALAALVPSSRSAGRAMAGLLALVVAGSLVADRSGAWDPGPHQAGSGRRAYDRTLRTIEDLVHSAPPGDTVRIDNRGFGGIKLISRRERFPGWAGLFVIVYPTNEVEGRTVRFVEPDPAVVEEARRVGGRVAELIEAVQTVPGRN